MYLNSPQSMLQAGRKCTGHLWASSMAVSTTFCLHSRLRLPGTANFRWLIFGKFLSHRQESREAGNGHSECVRVSHGGKVHTGLAHGLVESSRGERNSMKPAVNDSLARAADPTNLVDKRPQVTLETHKKACH